MQCPHLGAKEGVLLMLNSADVLGAIPAGSDRTSWVSSRNTAQQPF